MSSIDIWTNTFLYIYCRHELVYQRYDITAGANEVLHNVQGLQPGAEYLFVVTASNQAGEGTMSNSRSAKTLNAGLFLYDKYLL